jgi:protein O-mannosyl-transferase
VTPKKQSPNAGRRSPVWALVVAVLVATVVVYLPAMRAPYEFDDAKSIPGNPTIVALWPLSVPLHPPHNTTVAGRPIVNVTLAINYAINERLGVDQRPDPQGPNKTLGLHLVNLLMHLGCGLFLFGIIRRTMRQTGRDDRADSIAVIVTTLWLVHPIQTEAVNYLIQRTEVLVSLCYAGTLYAWIRAWDATRPGSRLTWRILAVVICLLGMGSKEVMITAPLAVLLYDRAFRVSSWKALFAERIRTVFYCAFAATSIWLLVMVAGNARFSTVGFGLGIPWYRYGYSQCWAIARYLWLVIWPSQLTLDYGARPVAGLAGVPGLILLASFGIATMVAWTRPSRWGWFGFVGALFFLLLAPSSSVVPITTEIAAERRIYLALAPVLMLLVLAVEWGLARPSSDQVSHRRHRLFRGFVVAVAVALMVRTYQRSSTYADPEALWRDAVETAPNNPRAYDNLAAVMFSSDPRRLAEATFFYRKALEIDSTYLNAWRGLASVAVDEGRLSDARALLEHVLAIQPEYVEGVDLLGRTLLRMGRPDLAVPYLQRFAAAFPSDSSLYSLGVGLLQVGRFDSATVALRAALQLNPGRTDVLGVLGGLLVEQGRGAEAVPLLERLVSAGGSSAVDVGLLSLAYAQSGRANDAAAAARVAVQSAPGNVAVLILAGRAMLVAKRGVEATQYLSEALRVNPGNREAVAYLAKVRALTR